ncbi:MAG TPA: hypothetical protein VIN07_06375 [Flavipsychrobacter sp.]
MSYVSSFVQTQPTAKIVVTENRQAKAVANIPTVARKEATTKISLFITILACLVLAVAL